VNRSNMKHFLRFEVGLKPTPHLGLSATTIFQNPDSMGSFFTLVLL